MLKQLAKSKNQHDKNLDKTVNRDTPSRGEPGRPTIVPSQCHFAPAPPEACARHWGSYQASLLHQKSHTYGAGDANVKMY